MQSIQMHPYIVDVIFKYHTAPGMFKEFFTVGIFLLYLILALHTSPKHLISMQKKKIKKII